MAVCWLWLQPNHTSCTVACGCSPAVAAQMRQGSTTGLGCAQYWTCLGPVVLCCAVAAAAGPVGLLKPTGFFSKASIPQIKPPVLAFLHLFGAGGASEEPFGSAPGIPFRNSRLPHTAPPAAILWGHPLNSQCSHRLKTPGDTQAT